MGDHTKTTWVRCVDLCCGAGGLSLGLTGAGLPVCLGVDIDPAMGQTYRQHTGAAFRASDLTKIHPDVLDEAWGKARYKVLAGSPPCQAFSSLRNPRHGGRADANLIKEFIRLALTGGAHVVIMENVPNMASSALFKNACRTLIGAGFEVAHRVIDYADLGGGQIRRRLVLFASRLGEVALPEPVSDEAGIRTVRDLIADLPNLPAGGQSPVDRLHCSAPLSQENLARIRASRPGGSWAEWPAYLRLRCHIDLDGYKDVYGRMEWDQPGPTLTTRFYHYSNGRFGHPEQDRALSLREGARLQGFPDSCRFIGPGQPLHKRLLGRMIGNAVPVDMAGHLGKTVLGHLEQHG